MSKNGLHINDMYIVGYIPILESAMTRYLKHLMDEPDNNTYTL
jgi:hypothetical protein